MSNNHDKYGIRMENYVRIQQNEQLKNLLETHDALIDQPKRLLGRYDDNIVLCTRNQDKGTFQWFEPSDIVRPNEKKEEPFVEGDVYTVVVNHIPKQYTIYKSANVPYFKWIRKSGGYFILLEDDVKTLSEIDKARIGLDEYEQRQKEKLERQRKIQKEKLEERIKMRDEEGADFSKTQREIMEIVERDKIDVPINDIMKIVLWFKDDLRLQSTSKDYLRMASYMLLFLHLEAKHLIEDGKDTDVINITSENMFPSIIFTRDFYQCMCVYQSFHPTTSPLEEYTRYICDTTKFVEKCEHFASEKTDKMTVVSEAMDENAIETIETIKIKRQIQYYRRECDRWAYYNDLDVNLSYDIRPDEDMMVEHEQLWDQLEPHQQEAISWFTDKLWNEFCDECRQEYHSKTPLSEEIDDLTLKLHFYKNRRDQRIQSYYNARSGIL